MWVGRGGASQDTEHEGVAGVGQDPGPAEQQRSRHRPDNGLGLDEVLGVWDDQVVLPAVLGVEVEVVDDGGSLLVNLYPGIFFTLKPVE